MELDYQTARAECDRRHAELERALGRIPGLDDRGSAPMSREARVATLLAVVLVVTAAVFHRRLTTWFAADVTTAAPAASSSPSSDIDHYTCSMHPSVKQQGPGKCPPLRHGSHR